MSSKIQKILAITTIRSDYDLMSPLYRLLDNDDEIDFQILVAGAHLSQSFGNSVKQIEEDNFTILSRVESLINSDSKSSRLKSASILFQCSIDIISNHNPDLIIYAGDREDVMIASIIGGYLGIPTAHFYGGDHVNNGFIDNPIRHATSKLSSIHFVTLDEHKERLIKMGESQDRIFVTGNISLDKFVSFSPFSLKELQESFNLQFQLKAFSLLIFHPVTEEIKNLDIIFENILSTLTEHNITTFVSYPNVDPGNQKIITIIDKYQDNSNFIFYKNLDRDTFLSIYKRATFIIGNSSSGICEAASIPIPAIDVGSRQQGRHADKNVIRCGYGKQELSQAIEKSQSSSFLSSIAQMKNPYGNGKSAEKAYNIIKQIDPYELLLKTEDPLEGTENE